MSSSAVMPGTDLTQHLLMKMNSLTAEETDGRAAVKEQTLKKAAEDFEGVLLSAWLEEIQKSSLDPSGAAQDPGAETLRSMGTQAVAHALAQRGGLGIAHMIVQHYLPTFHPQALAGKKPESIARQEL